MNKDGVLFPLIVQRERKEASHSTSSRPTYGPLPWYELGAISALSSMAQVTRSSSCVSSHNSLSARGPIFINDSARSPFLFLSHCVSLSLYLLSPCFFCHSKGAFLVRDNRVFKGPLGRSLRSFACTAHSTHSLRSTSLRYTCSTRSLRSQARSLTSFTPS